MLYVVILHVVENAYVLLHVFHDDKLLSQASFTLPKLGVRFEHKKHNLFFENHIEGIQLKCVKTRSSEDVGESTRLDFQLDFSEIHVSFE